MTVTTPCRASKGPAHAIVAPKANKPIGEWNAITITVRGSKIKVVLNGETLVDADLKDYEKEHGDKHPGIKRAKGRVGFQSYNFRNVFLKEL
jgi:hypothetical protein